MDYINICISYFFYGGFIFEEWTLVECVEKL